MTELDITSLERLLAILLPDLTAMGQPYCVIGSAALVLHGLPITCNDLDILTTGEGSQWLSNRWLRFHTHHMHPDSDGRFRSVFHGFRVWGCEVEVMGDMDYETSRGWKPVRVRDTETICGTPVATLAEMERLLTEFNREKDKEKRDLIRLHTAPTPGADTILIN